MVPCVGSWAGHVSGSSDYHTVEPCGFEKTHFHGQAGTRRWRAGDQKRYLCGFSFTGMGDAGPYVDEAYDADSLNDLIKKTQWVSAMPPLEVRYKAGRANPPEEAKTGCPLEFVGEKNRDDEDLGQPPFNPYYDVSVTRCPHFAHARPDTTPPEWNNKDEWVDAVGEQAARIRRRHLALWRRRFFDVEHEHIAVHASVRDQCPPRWTAVPKKKHEDRPGGYSLATAYLQCYHRRWDNAFRCSMAEGQMSGEATLNPRSQADRSLWLNSNVVPSAKVAENLQLFNRQGSSAGVYNRKRPLPPGQVDAHGEAVLAITYTDKVTGQAAFSCNVT